MSRSCWSSAGSRSITSASSDGCSASRRCSRRRHVRADTVSAIAGGSTRLTSRCLVAGVFSLVEPEPTRGLETRTYRLQDSLSTLTMAATSDFSVYSDRSGGHSGYGGSEFASQVVSPTAVVFKQIYPAGHGRSVSPARQLPGCRPAEIVQDQIHEVALPCRAEREGSHGTVRLVSVVRSTTPRRDLQHRAGLGERGQGLHRQRIDLLL